MATGTVLGRLLVELGLDASDFEKGLGKAERDVDGFGGKAAKGGAVAGAAIAGVGVAAAAGLGASIKVAADFEHQMDQVGAVAGVSGETLDRLTAKAISIGKETAFSSTETAKAMELLAQNGLTAEQILNGAADATVALAAAGGTDMATAADVASTAMGVFNLGAEDMHDVVNRIAGAANVSRFGVEDMSLAIGQGAAAAKTFGVSFEDFSTAIAATATSFNSGADAGTSFKTFMMSIAAPTGAGADKIKELGLNFRDAQGRMKPMAGIIAELETKLGGLNQEARDKALRDIFGSDALRMGAGLLALADGSKTASEKFKELNQTMGGTDAAAIAKQRMDNFKGSMESLKGSIEAIQIEIGMKLLPVLTSLARFLADFLPKAFDAIGSAISEFRNGLTYPFEDWEDAAEGSLFFRLGHIIREDIIPPITELWAALQPIRDAFAQAFEWVTTNQEAMTAAGIIIGTVLVAAVVALGVAMAGAAISAIAFMAPFLLIAVALGAVIAAVVLLVKHWDELSAKFPILQHGLDALIKAFNHVKEAVAPIGPKIAELAEMIRKTITEIVGFIRKHWDEISSIIESALKIIVATIKLQFDLIVAAIKLALDLAINVLKIFVGLFTGDWDMLWEGIKGIFNAFKTFFETAFGALWEWIKTIAKEGLNILKQLFTIAWDEIKGIVSSAWDKIKGFFSDAWSTIKGGVSDAWRAIVEMFQNAMVDAFKAVTQGLGWVMDEFTSLPGDILRWLGDLGSLLWDAGVKLIKGFIGGIASMFGEVAGKLGELKDKLTGWKGPPAEDARLLTGNGELIIQGLVKGFENEEDRVRQSMEEITSKVLRMIHELMEKSAAAARSGMLTLAAEMMQKAAEVKASLESAVTSRNAMAQIVATTPSATPTYAKVAPWTPPPSTLPWGHSQVSAASAAPPIQVTQNIANMNVGDTGRTTSQVSRVGWRTAQLLRNRGLAV